MVLSWKSFFKNFKPVESYDEINRTIFVVSLWKILAGLNFFWPVYIVGVFTKTPYSKPLFRMNIETRNGYEY